MIRARTILLTGAYYLPPASHLDGQAPLSERTGVVQLVVE
jgi:hypothetical protein